VSEPSAPQQGQSHDEPAVAEKVNGTGESTTAGLSTMPEKRPSRRFFGLFKGQRSD
jgi:hypothetical protein